MKQIKLILLCILISSKYLALYSSLQDKVEIIANIEDYDYSDESRDRFLGIKTLSTKNPDDLKAFHDMSERMDLRPNGDVMRCLNKINHDLNAHGNQKFLKKEGLFRVYISYQMNRYRGSEGSYLTKISKVIDGKLIELVTPRNMDYCEKGDLTRLIKLFCEKNEIANCYASPDSQNNFFENFKP